MPTEETEQVSVEVPANSADPAAATAEQVAPSGFGRLGWLFALAVCLLIAGVIYSGIHSRVQARASLERTTRASEKATVSVIYPKGGSDASEILLPGNTQAFTDTPIYARTSGYLKKWYFDIGAHVRQGQLLALIETPELDQQLQQAEAELKTAQANLDLAQITAARWQHLLKTNSVSKQETDQATSDMVAKQAVVAQNEANVRRLQQLQSYERISAPFDGVITARNVDIGDLIQAGNPSTSKELFHLSSVNRLRVYVAVPEVYSESVHDGEKVPLSLDSMPGETFSGTLVRNSDAIDLASRTLNIEVDVDNPKGRLKPGAYAFVHLPVTGATGAVTVPANTLLFRSEGLRVGVVKDGRVALVPVTIGHDYGSSVEVVSGLSPRDAVIVDPSDSLENGAEVAIEGPAGHEVARQ
jgi:RND family efflux transporter MFP subunit